VELHALINLYNDRQFLAACLESICNDVDSVIVADGAYQLYYEEYKHHDPHAKPTSTDGSLEILQAFKDLPTLRILRQPGGGCWLNQTLKRSALIDAVPDGDWFIIIDADEMMMGDIQEGMEAVYESGCVVGSTAMYTPGTDVDRFKREWHPRLFKKLEGMHYSGTHWHLRDKYERVLEDKYPVYWTEKMVIIHLKPFKSQLRIIPHTNYMAELAERGWLEPEDLGKLLMSGIKKVGA
jgi:glycosyltransferase involved in cell wall biosynthesis